jgi:hypothetical protein
MNKLNKSVSFVLATLMLVFATPLLSQAVTKEPLHEIVSLVPPTPPTQQFTSKIQSIDYDANRITSVAHNLATGVETLVYVNYTDETVLLSDNHFILETDLIPLTMMQYKGTWTVNADGSLEISNLKYIVAYIPPAI